MRNFGHLLGVESFACFCFDSNLYPRTLSPRSFQHSLYPLFSISPIAHFSPCFSIHQHNQPRELLDYRRGKAGLAINDRVFSQEKSSSHFRIIANRCYFSKLLLQFYLAFLVKPADVPGCFLLASFSPARPQGRFRVLHHSLSACALYFNFLIFFF